MIATESIRRIPILSYLLYKGFEPASYSNGKHWFHSPLREGDKKPSFVVHESINRWYDFAEGKGGSIIDLAMSLEPDLPYVEILRKLQDFSGEADTYVPLIKNTPGEAVTPSTFCLDEIVPLNRSYKLTAYLQSRGINPTVANRNGLKVAFYYTPNGYKRFALAFRNDAGGYELRNPNFKGTLGHKAISTIDGVDGSRAIVVEGFMDYLSFRQLHPEYNGKAIVLNSTALAEKAIEKITSCSEVHLLLDNDPAGEEKTKLLTKILSETAPACQCIDGRTEYAAHNDLNEYLQKQTLQVSKPILAVRPTIRHGQHKPNFKL